MTTTTTTKGHNMEKKYYVAKILIETANPHITNFAEALYNNNADVDRAIEFLSCWDNFNEHTEWSDNDNTCIYDTCTEFTVGNVFISYLAYVEAVLPEQLEDDIQYQKDIVADKCKRIRALEECIKRALPNVDLSTIR